MKAEPFIQSYMHCKKCIAEWQDGKAPGESPATYARLSVGFTPRGVQVWCNRHSANVVHIDFEGMKHPADLSLEGSFA